MHWQRVALPEHIHWIFLLDYLVANIRTCMIAVYLANAWAIRIKREIEPSLDTLGLCQLVQKCLYRYNSFIITFLKL